MQSFRLSPYSAAESNVTAAGNVAAEIWILLAETGASGEEKV